MTTNANGRASEQKESHKLEIGTIFTFDTEHKYQIVESYAKNDKIIKGGNSDLYECQKLDSQESQQLLLKCAMLDTSAGDQLKKEIDYYLKVSAKKPFLQAVSVQCHASGCDLNTNMVWLVMDKHECTLRDLRYNKQDNEKGKHTLTYDKCLNYAIQMLDAFEILLSYGIVHGDASLSNILIDKDGNILLCDFGQYQLFLNPLSIGKSPHTGTSKINSRNQMQRGITKKSDSIENWIYMVVQCMYGVLDWTSEADDREMNKNIRHKTILSKKDFFWSGRINNSALSPLIYVARRMIENDKPNFAVLRLTLTGIFKNKIQFSPNIGPYDSLQLCIVCARIFVCAFAYDKNAIKQI